MAGRVDFIATATMLGSQRNIDEKRTGIFRVVTGDDEDRSGLGSQTRSVSQISPGLAFIEGIEDFLHNGP